MGLNRFRQESLDVYCTHFTLDSSLCRVSPSKSIEQMIRCNAGGATWQLHQMATCKTLRASAIPALNSLGLDQALDLSDSVVQDLLLELVVVERVLHLLDHASCQLALFLLALARLEAHPRVEHRLDLGGERRLLSQLKHLLLGLCGLLSNRVKSLSQSNHVLLRLHRGDARLHGFSVLGASAIEDLGDFLLLRKREGGREAR